MKFPLLQKISKVIYISQVLNSQELKKWEETLGYVSCFSLHFFRALAASCVLYNRTEHSQGFAICWFEWIEKIKNTVICSALLIEKPTIK